MYIKKVKIQNFKCYREFEIELNDGLNIVVGNNDAGKSTILEAINLALTGLINGKSIWNELSQYLFNKASVDEYISSVNMNKPRDCQVKCVNYFRLKPDIFVPWCQSVRQ